MFNFFIWQEPLLLIRLYSILLESFLHLNICWVFLIKLAQYYVILHFGSVVDIHFRFFIVSYTSRLVKLGSGWFSGGNSWNNSRSCNVGRYRQGRICVGRLVSLTSSRSVIYSILRPWLFSWDVFRPLSSFSSFLWLGKRKGLNLFFW